VRRSYRAAVWLITLLPRLLHLLVFGRNHRQRELYATVTRLFPELGVSTRLQQILNPDGFAPDGEVGTGYGFGSFEHLVTAPPAQNGYADTTPAKATGRGRQRKSAVKPSRREDATPAQPAMAQGNAAETGRSSLPSFLSGTLATLLVCGGLGLALLAGAMADGAGRTPPQGWTDTRQDVYQLTGQNVQDADSVVALYPASSVRDRGDGTSELQTVPYGLSHNLCLSERFWQQPSGSACSGVLVGKDVIATAGHCIVGEPMTTFSYVFGYHMRDATTPNVVIANTDIYQAREVLAWHLDNKASDWALIRLDRPVVGHRIVPVRQAGTISKGQPVHAIGYPLGLPAKFAPGRVQTVTDTALVTSISSYPGNSGSPVFNSTTHALEGIILGGNGPKLVRQGGCFVTRARDSVATRASAFAHALSTMQRNP
jgi:S1-C subfamily serine protease